MPGFEPEVLWSRPRVLAITPHNRDNSRNRTYTTQGRQISNLVGSTNSPIVVIKVTDSLIDLNPY